MCIRDRRLQLGNLLLALFIWSFRLAYIKVFGERRELVVESFAIFHHLLCKLFHVVTLRFFLGQLPQLHFYSVTFKHLPDESLIRHRGLAAGGRSAGHRLCSGISGSVTGSVTWSGLRKLDLARRSRI